MRSHCLFLGLGAALATSLAAIPVAAAHDGAGGPVGIGVGLGSPTTLSIDMAATPFSSVELALGMATLDGDGSYGHLVFKSSLVRLVRNPSVSLPLYLGAGGFLLDHDHDLGGSDLDIGLRVPVGLDIDLQRAPVQFFGEVALDATLVTVDHDDDDDLAVDGTAGVRVWF
jgi:hypothetical protein